MKRPRLWLTLILIVSVLLRSHVSGHVASTKLRPNEHKGSIQPKTQSAQRNRPVEATVPFSIYARSESALLEALRTLHAQEAANARQAEPKYEPWYAPGVLAQIVLCIIGGLYTCFAFKQWGAIKRGNENAREAFEITQRAYLSVENIKVSDFQDGEEPVVEFDIRNRGRLPASRVLVTVTTSIKDRAIPSLIGMTGHPVPEGHGPVISADTISHRARPLALPEKWQLGQVYAGGALLQLEIEVFYMDGFDHQRMWGDLLLYYPDLRTFEPWSTREKLPETLKQ
jgi:hypothetical protein